MDPYDLSTEKRPIWCNANIWAYLKYMWSYSVFCVYISKFSLLRQQGLIWVIFRLHS